MLEKAHCVKCGYTWVKRIEKPTCCPHCSNYDIDKPYVRKVAGYQEPLRFKKTSTTQQTKVKA